MIIPFSSVFLLAGLTLAAKKATPILAENNPDSSAGKTLYMTSPACGFFRCAVTWTKGSTVNVNWLAPPAGQVSVMLASNNGGSNYPIIASFPGTTTNCDAGGGAGVAVAGATCGGLSFIVPSGWEERANYTIVVQSLSSTSDVGYTDAVTIAPAVGGATGPTGNSVTILGASTTATNSSAAATVASSTSGGVAITATTSGMSISKISSTMSGAAPTGALGSSVSTGLVPAATGSSIAKSSAGALGKSLGIMFFSGVGAILLL